MRDREYVIEGWIFRFDKKLSHLTIYSSRRGNPIAELTSCTSR